MLNWLAYLSHSFRSWHIRHAFSSLPLIHITSTVVKCCLISIFLSCQKWQIYMSFVVIILLLLQSRLSSVLQDSPTTFDILFCSHQCCRTHRWLTGDIPLLPWWHCLCYLNLYYSLDNYDMALSALNKVGAVCTTCHVACTDFGTLSTVEKIRDGYTEMKSR